MARKAKHVNYIHQGNICVNEDWWKTLLQVINLFIYLAWEERKGKEGEGKKGGRRKEKGGKEGGVSVYKGNGCAQ